MSEYQESTSIQAPADQVFDYVSDPNNMPQYLPTVHQAEVQGQSRVEVEGEAGGRQYHSDGRFEVNHGEKRMTWGSDGENRYAGWLQVTGEDEAEVTVHLAFEPRPDQDQAMRDQMGSRDSAIQRGLHDALQSIKNHFEGGGKVANPAETGNRGYVG